jgi:hypothetical protein
MTFHILRFPNRTEFAYVEDEPGNLDKPFKVNAGKTCAGLVHGPLLIPFYKKHKGMKLDDFVANLWSWILCSERARAVIAKECGNVEIYPAEFLDHKKRPVALPYFLVHPVGTVDCVDLRQSKYTPDRAWKDKVLTFYKLVLDERRIPPDAKLFRMKEMPEAIIIRSDLVEKLQAVGATGFALKELGVPIML